MWTITRIDESDYGCEERLPGEPLMLLVTLACDDGRIAQFEVAENWMEAQKLDEGDEWPDDLENENEDEINAASQADWAEHYFHHLNKYMDI